MVPKANIEEGDIAQPQTGSLQEPVRNGGFLREQDDVKSVREALGKAHVDPVTRAWPDYRKRQSPNHEPGSCIHVSRPRILFEIESGVGGGSYAPELGGYVGVEERILSG